MIVSKGNSIHSNNFRNSRVLIIGLGQLGLPIAKYVKEKGFDTYGYDIEQKAIERAEKVVTSLREQLALY